jgi:hypothetical protein
MHDELAISGENSSKDAWTYKCNARERMGNPTGPCESLLHFLHAGVMSKGGGIHHLCYC